MTWTYSWSNEKYSSFAVRPVDLNLVDMSYINQDFFEKLQNLYLRNSYTSQLVAGISGKLHLQQPVEESGTQRHARAVQLGDGGQPHRRAGTPLLVAGQRQGLLRNFRYSILPVFPRRSERQPQDHAGRKSGHRRAALRRLRTGLRQLDLDPFDRLFYCGGSNGMRGWIPRMLGPGSVPVDPDKVTYPVQLGDMKLEANLEFRFPIWGNLPRRHLLRRGKHLVHGKQRRGVSARSGLPHPRLLQTAGIQHRPRHPARHQVRRAAPGLGVFSCTIPTIRPASGGSTTSSGATRRSTSAWDIRSDEAVDRRQTPPICISTEICLLLQ